MSIVYLVHFKCITRESESIEIDFIKFDAELRNFHPESYISFDLFSRGTLATFRIIPRSTYIASSTHYGKLLTKRRGFRGRRLFEEQ